MVLGEIRTRRVFPRFSPGLIATAVLLFAGSVASWAQTSTAGTVAGQVTDESNAAVPGATVKVVEVSTNLTQQSVTNEAGRYIFSQVPPGKYNVIFTKDGFTTYYVNSQGVEVGAVLTLNAKMKVGATTTTVEVSASTGAELQTMNATVGNTIDNKTTLLLPTIGRDVSSLAVLQPGVMPGGFTAGSHAEQNSFTLDGGPITDDMAGNTTGYNTNFTGFGGTQSNGTPSGVIPTPIESIEEVRIATINQTSDFANSSGSQIQMVTKRGSNQFHGAAYMYYFDTTIGAANTWTANHTPATVNGVAYGYTPIVSNHRDRFGGAIGGPLVPKDFLGKKWYFFFNYEGMRFPNVASYQRNVPSVLLRNGIIQVPNSAGTYLPYNITNSPVTLNGTTYPVATCGTGSCDPRNLGMSPVISKIWNTQMPLPNNPLAGDNYNTQGYLSTIRAPINTNNYVGRIDHDINDKWRFYTTYRDYKLVALTTNQVDIGGVLPGDTLGQPQATAPRPQQPSYWNAGLTTIIKPTVTNNVVFSYTRNFWQWGSANAPPQLSGLGGAVEIGGESSSALIPYNINTQSVRARFWDGQDKLLRDDVTWIKGNHLIGLGGAYQRNFDFHLRTDNGNGINNAIVYQSTSSGVGISSAGYIPSTVASSAASTWNTYYAEILGIISQPQVAYTRTGNSLNINPVGSAAYDKSVIPYYSLYVNDSWHVKPSLTLTYGIGWNLEMPPLEQDGKQVMLVDPNGAAFTMQSYADQRKSAALAGSTYDPQLGFALVGNVAGGRKYPYDPFYKEFSPRIAAAWAPKFQDGILHTLFGDGKTVLRGGYSRIFGRLNGVNLVLSPLLGVGLIQAVTCQGANMNGTCSGAGSVNAANAFRIGPDGLSAPLPAPTATLPQPCYPGFNCATAGDASVLDPAYKPDRTDQFTLTIQREINSKMSLEVGFIGKILRNETTEYDLDAVPYMTTLGGQTFANAYANTYWAIWGGGTPSAQPFFENALGGANSSYCQGYGSCTAAVVSKVGKSLFQNTQVSDIWAALNKANSWTLGRTMISSPINGGSGQGTSFSMSGSLGTGNYNGLFVTFRTSDFHGLTTVSNFTWSRSLGTGTIAQYNSAYTQQNMFDPQSSYGPNSFDYKAVYNLSATYQPPVFRGQKGVLGHALGGWTFSPIFTAQSGALSSVSYSEINCTACQAFGEVGNTAASDSSVAEVAVFASKYTGGSSANYGVTGANGIGTKTPNYGINQFQHPDQVISQFRPCVLGYDTSCGGYGNIRGLPTWNVDMEITKDLGIHREQVGAQFFVIMTNMMNHFQPGGASLGLASPTSFGQITSQGNTPRNMEFGIRLHF